MIQLGYDLHVAENFSNFSAKYVGFVCGQTEKQAVEYGMQYHNVKNGRFFMKQPVLGTAVYDVRDGKIEFVEFITLKPV